MRDWRRKRLGVLRRSRRAGPREAVESMSKGRGGQSRPAVVGMSKMQEEMGDRKNFGVNYRSIFKNFPSIVARRGREKRGEGGGGGHGKSRPGEEGKRRGGGFL